MFMWSTLIARQFNLFEAYSAETKFLLFINVSSKLSLWASKLRHHYKSKTWTSNPKTHNPSPLYSNDCKSVLFALIIQALGSHWLQQQALYSTKKKGSSSKLHIRSKHHMNPAYDSSVASLSLVPCIGSASFSSPQLLKELMHGFDCDRLTETGKEWFRCEIWIQAHTRPSVHQTWFLTAAFHIFVI